MVKPRKVAYNGAERAMTPDEYSRVRAATKPEYADIFDFYLLTGLWRGEGVQVTSKNFNFETMTATFFQPKTQRHRKHAHLAGLSQGCQAFDCESRTGKAPCICAQAVIDEDIPQGADSCAPSLFNHVSLAEAYLLQLAGSVWNWPTHLDESNGKRLGRSRSSVPAFV